MVCGAEQLTDKSVLGFVLELDKQPCAGGRDFTCMCFLQFSDYLSELMAAQRDGTWHYSEPPHQEEFQARK